MNKIIESLFKDFEVDGVSIPVSFLFYEGHGEPYVTYQLESMDSALTADDELQAYVEYYDFDIYSKGNYIKIIEAVKQILTGAGFMFQPSRSSGDMYETDTGYYHKTLNFTIPKGE